MKRSYTSTSIKLDGVTSRDTAICIVIAGRTSNLKIPPICTPRFILRGATQNFREFEYTAQTMCYQLAPLRVSCYIFQPLVSQLASL
jgi:hypothetical protein